MVLWTHTIAISYTENFDAFEYEKRLLPRCIHHFKPDLINNMDHMRISGYEPSSVKRYESTEVDRRTWLHVPSKYDMTLQIS